ncbi:RnfH family protein [Ferrimonas lipolytica]|uniref:UPF0125 protein HER31_02780 n=1 Tax=Ferrimonas lipolytica TaxID=2724191 RepID=A0A6H1UB80_9GAMM|nr:RnfH family protein [Ferrimonas lipolytica]QIZ75899.1 RnfH family protein [Ferrimonas lipolytica]
MTDTITIEVVYALPNEAFVRKVDLPKGATVEEAVQTCGVLERYTDIDLKKHKVGIFSRTVKPSQELFNGDRVEIYRPLLADPREVRKRRAEKAKEEGRADATTGGKPNPLRAK